MSDNWNQQPGHSQNADNNRPPKKGGLLSSYKGQQNSPASQSAPGINPPSQGPGQFSPPQKKSGLLSGYNAQQPPPAARPYPGQPQQPPAPPPFSGQPQQPSSARPYPGQQPPSSARPYPGQPQQPPARPYPGQPQQPYFNQGQQAPQPGAPMFYTQGMQGMVDRMRQWTGKMASMAGYRPPPQQPPAPYMQMYHGAPGAFEQQARDQPWKRSLSTRVAWQMRMRRERWQRGPQRIWVNVLTVLLVLVVFASLGGSAYAYTFYQQQLPRVSELANMHVPQNARIYDRNNQVLFEAYDSADQKYGGRRIPVTYDDIPPVMRNAMVAAEDNTFWTNSGVNPTAILRAAATHNGGGSTITQQVIKNLTQDTTYSLARKIPEAALAIGLTQEYPKSKILEMYFNVAPFGSFDNGVEAATEKYFHLSRDCDPAKNFKCVEAVSKLTYNQDTKKNDPILGLARASLLAAIPNSPYSMDPTLGDSHKQLAFVRQDYVLDQMINQNMTVDGSPNGQPITPDIKKKVEDLMAKMKFTPYQGFKKAPHFVDYIIRQVSRALGNGNIEDGLNLFQRSGLNIRTTIDLNLENYVEHAVKRHLDQPELQYFPLHVYRTLSADLNVNTAAVVVLDAKTGEILAMNGSANYTDADIKVGAQYNIAAPPDNGNGFDPNNPKKPMGRPPGSTMKPIVYASAFQMGWYPNIVLPDERTYFPGGAAAGTQTPYQIPDKQLWTYKGSLYIPTDYGQTFHPYLNPQYAKGGADTIHYATSNSFNIPALKAMQFAGPDYVLNTARRMGITTLENNGIAWALGSQNVPLIQMTGAYQVFANGGKRVPPQGVLDIFDNYGHNLFHYDPTHPPTAQVLSPQVSYMMTSVLTDQPSRYVEFGNDYDLSFADRDPTCATDYINCKYPVAAKTGTSDDFRDNLTIGYTPDVVVGVWAGNANDEAMGQDTVGITGAAPIWHSVIERALGWCGAQPTGGSVYPYYASDDIDCGSQPHARFTSDNPSWQFNQPAGLTMQSLSALNGLLGGGTPADYMPVNMIPTQAGLPYASQENKKQGPQQPNPPSSPAPQQ